MKISKNILPPLKRRDFEIAPQNQFKVSLETANLHFENTINNFKKFAVGESYWLFADLTSGLILNVGGKSEKIISLKPEQLIGNPPDEMFSRTHPEDVEAMYAFSNYYIQFALTNLKNKFQIYHPTLFMRLKNFENLYRWCMVQYGDYLTDEEGNLLVGLTFVTDISHIKTEGVAMMSIVDTEKEICQHFYCQSDNKVVAFSNEIPRLSNREIEVLNYLSIGYSSKQIAFELNISTKTVDNHRQNMLHKADCKSSSELISFAVKTGYL